MYLVWLFVCVVLLTGLNKLLMKFDNSDLSSCVMTVLAAISIWVFVFVPISLDEKISICNLVKSEIQSYDSIKQDSDGRYFVLTKDFDKIYPKVKIVDTETKFTKEYYKQKNFFLDDIVFDFNLDVLYLNLKQVEGGE